MATLKNIVRTIYVFGSLVPASILAIIVGILTLSHRKGINTLITVYGELATRTPGLEYVISGENNMQHRPTVFIFNHQSNSELFVLAYLMRKNVSAIAKTELLRSPIGPILWAGKMLFIDRSKSNEAIDIFKEAQEYVNQGISFAVAPEGTRSDDYALGNFKKGAFRLAMQTGVTLTPIIFKNSHDTLPKGNYLVRKSKVYVKILEPISTQDWEIQALDSKIEEVRNLFENTLNEWN